MNSTLNSAFNILFAGSVFCGMACSFVMIYANLRVFAAQNRLRRLLQKSAPSVYGRLSGAAWRTGMNPWKLKAFLQSGELDEVPEIERAKADSRGAGRLLVRALVGFCALWLFGMVVAALAAALGSTDIRISR